ncbi:YdbL family protein [Erythrobacter donghaensis]|jgi:uncharacterized protein YdbL (DUF1318 family)|uniref:YdbL family protein n=1 Tax=Erythrobacter donghaensis TaxID=267135 RepID=UPI00093D97CD|nr:YdbL family protein [Erythrobacter donghaensis]
MLSAKSTRLAALLAVAALAVPAAAQRDPAFDAARASGKVGERVDGYVGIVGAETPDLRRIVDDINIKRKAVYAERAQAKNATIEEYALTIGCQQILKTAPGEKYQAPDGSWQTRTGAPPQRHPKCP